MPDAPLARGRRGLRRAHRRRPGPGPDLPRPAPAGQIQARRPVRPVVPGVADASSPRGCWSATSARADGARRRGDAVPRVRPPGAPRARRTARLGPVLQESPPSGTSSRRPRRCSRSGPGTRPSSVVRDQRGGEPIPAELVAKMPEAERVPARATRPARRCSTPRCPTRSTTPSPRTPRRWCRAQGPVRRVQLRARHALPRVVRSPSRGLHLSVLHVHVEPGDRQGPVPRPATRTTCSRPRWRTGTATGCSPPEAAGTPRTSSRTSSAARTRSRRSSAGWWG